ncbi:3-hydroxyacyl-CoA dehydrogenase family protein [Mycolicibacterium holsaticum]|uniref:3-hydroxyacyl-CoA dehydrogenase family protein n=1 Tax=Mycolicibacterium holsaticum TaxID=152142 RepID=UPI001C7DDA8C|nr:3-hydroxyacyl-CoA dehydrogenase family protein [Mycolicibacterium holsaticum]MDA4109360.1 3-hydroxyacyl-CoA dehydrogenase [Mycolicibacterium holsaticum DSM 44478 = JCM 12374]QZA15455.1 3-hydroxyacyl-CoA dehydrogenase family protein [Mycolicibacterium holsaticum DSM 44478 = JCM 12374]UNC12273.1 3-hydroxyacyl-CoA dehydrogenase family protein [Mycolicibacterium holsaticum DSM 44478 = JCM 12374]
MNGESCPARIAVVGGGRMGGGIAQAFAAAGSQVVIVEPDDQRAALERVSAGLHNAERRGSLGQVSAADVAGRVTAVSAPSQLAGEFDLAIEAVPEQRALKADVITAIENAVPPFAVIASNTSSLSITELVAALRDSTRFLGLHFFNPVPRSALVEIVRSPSTSDTTLTRARAWVRAIGKSDVVVNDSPGFATSRLGVCLGLEAIRMLEEGVADAADIDRAMELGYRHTMGPLRSTDLVGLDVRLAIAEHLYSTLGSRYEPPKLLREKVSRGELGRKSGHGFFTWDTVDTGAP